MRLGDLGVSGYAGAGVARRVRGRSARSLGKVIILIAVAFRGPRLLRAATQKWPAAIGFRVRVVVQYRARLRWSGGRRFGPVRTNKGGVCGTGGWEKQSMAGEVGQRHHRAAPATAQMWRPYKQTPAWLRQRTMTGARGTGHLHRWHRLSLRTVYST